MLPGSLRPPERRDLFGSRIFGFTTDSDRYCDRFVLCVHQGEGGERERPKRKPFLTKEAGSVVFGGVWGARIRSDKSGTQKVNTKSKRWILKRFPMDCYRVYWQGMRPQNLLFENWPLFR